MTVMKWPNRSRPQGFRVLDKTLGVQEYFFSKEYGSMSAARSAANAREERIQVEREKLLRERMKPKNVLFDISGRLRGVRVRLRKRPNREGCTYLTIQSRRLNDSELLSTDLSFSGRTFDEVFSIAQSKLLAHHKFQRRANIMSLFEEAKTYLKSDYKKVIPLD